jgi:phage shock protein E
MPRRSILLAILVLLAVLAVAACDSGEASEAPGAYTVSASEAVEMFEAGERTIIDVRMPAEFDDAHVVGALNVDVDAPDFADRIAELDPDERYVVYCRSGRRSAIAAAQMAEAGIKDIADAGGIVDLARAGAPVEASALTE